MKILFKLASRSRPDRFFKTLDNIISMCESDNYKIVVSIDYDDTLMNNDTVINRWLKDDVYRDKVSINVGRNKSKVQAINANINEVEDWDILVSVSDDQVFLVKGFDEIIRWEMKTNFPDLDGFINFKEPHTLDELCVMSIMGRVYYSRTNYIYHPSYSSLWCDNEATVVAKILKKYAYADTQIFAHEHVAWGYGVKDDLLRRNERFWRKDKSNYETRKRKNFDL